MDKGNENERDISGINTPDIEQFLNDNKEKIINSVMDKIFKYNPQKIKVDIKLNILDALVNELTKDVRFGIMIQFALANALMYSLWCGAQSEKLKKETEMNFKDEHLEQVQDAINKAFAIGRSYQL